MSAYHDLLKVQDHDTTSDQLRHRRRHLPELGQLAAVGDELALLEATLAEVTAAAAGAARAQRHLEGELSVVESKVTELETRLYSGLVTVPRELQAMQSEGEALRARRQSLEDEVLEAMDRDEALDAEVSALTRRRAELDTEGVRLRAAIAEAEAQVDRELAAELEARSVAAAGLPTDLAALYERLRTRLGGIAAAMLVNGRCGGCHLALPATEVARLRIEPPETLVRCEQCERILVRP